MGRALHMQRKRIESTGLPIAEATPSRRAPVAAAASTRRTEGRWAWRGVLRFLSGVHVLALADQAVVSATSFLTTVLVGRYTDPSQLGAYAIAVSVLASLFTIQGSLITLPYSIQRHRPLGTPAEHAGSSLAQGGLLSAVAIVLLAVTALGLLARGAPPEVTAMTWALAAVMPFGLLREFGRRFAFTHLQMAQALGLDAAVAVIQVSILGWLGWTGRMSAVTACGALGISCGLAAIGWLYVARTDFVIRVGQLWAATKQSWGLGKWLFVGQVITVQAQRYIPYWLMIVIAGAAATGIYAACMSVVSFVNPLMFGFANILTPRSVLAWKEGGGKALRRQTIRDSLFLGVLMLAFCLLVLSAGEEVMRFLYHGNEYEGHGHTIAVLAFATLASAIGMPASNALATMERPRAIVGVGIVGALLTVVLIWGLMAQWGLVGAAYGLLIANVFGSAGLWLAFLTLTPRACDPAPAIRVLQKFTQTFDPGGWAIARLGEGDHATVYAVQSKNRQPIWRTYHDLVIKLFKPEAGLDPEMVVAQFDSLSRLHAALHGQTCGGWKISTPKPLHVCESPLALIMTTVPGKDLKSCAATDDDLTPEILESIGRAFVAAMQKSWSRGQLHGDLALQNILYDIEGRNLSLIDPGTLESCSVCNNPDKSRRPAVLELGHILRDLGTDVRDMIGNPIARLRRQIFVESALRTFLETIGPLQEKQQALHEIRACAQAHLWNILELSWSLHGLWHRLLRQVVVRRMDSMLDGLRAELEVRGRAAENSAVFPSRTQRAEA
jgi:O-antigen/teichoic acid export membrane protein